MDLKPQGAAEVEPLKDFGHRFSGSNAPGRGILPKKVLLDAAPVFRICVEIVVMFRVAFTGHEKIS